MNLKNILLFHLVLSLVFSVTGCDGTKQEQVTIKKEPKKVQVRVHTIQRQTYPIWLDFTGKTEALESVYVTSRVAGELKSVCFKAGDVVKKGDLLFRIDDREYRSVLNQKKSALSKDISSLNLALANLKRYEPLVKKGLAPREKLDELTASVEKYRAMVESDRSAVNEAQLDVDYSAVKATINGRIGKALVDIGNIVKTSDQLANIVQTNQLYVNFSPSTNDVFLLNRYKSEKYPKVEVLPENVFDKHLSLKGRIDFIDNVTDKATGTVSIRAKVDNPKELLFPGSFVKIKVFLTDQQSMIAVHPNNISQNQLGCYVFIVNRENQVQISQVELYYSNKDIAIIKSGIKEGDRIIVSPTSQLQEHQTVTTEEVANPVTMQ